jgi:hypothetical protein
MNVGFVRMIFAVLTAFSGRRATERSSRRRRGKPQLESPNGELSQLGCSKYSCPNVIFTAAQIQEKHIKLIQQFVLACLTVESKTSHVRSCLVHTCMQSSPRTEHSAMEGDDASEREEL